MRARTLGRLTSCSGEREHYNKSLPICSAPFYLLLHVGGVYVD